MANTKTLDDVLIIPVEDTRDQLVVVELTSGWYDKVTSLATTAKSVFADHPDHYLTTFKFPEFNVCNSGVVSIPDDETNKFKLDQYDRIQVDEIGLRFIDTKMLVVSRLHLPEGPYLNLQWRYKDHRDAGYAMSSHFRISELHRLYPLSKRIVDSAPASGQ